MTGLKNSVPVAEAEDVADHGHDGEGAREVGPAVEPDLGGGSFQQQNLGQVVAVSIFQRMLEHLHLGGHTYMTSAVGGGRGVAKKQTKGTRLREFCT